MTKRQPSRPLYIRGGTDNLIAPPDLGGNIVNMYATEEGTLRTVWGPTPYVPLYGSNGAPATSDTACDDGVSSTLTYGPMRGIHHAMLSNNREILLLHTFNEIWVFEGWNTGWRCLIGPAAAAPDLEAELPSDTSSRFPTQFETTPNGVIIIPQGSRAYFYDGIVVAEFGYYQSPSPPSGLGPKTKDITDINGDGYAHDARVDPNTAAGAQSSAMHPIFGTCRVGSVETAAQGSGVGVLGYLKPGRYRARVQWVDRWGNLSPASPPSNDVTFDRQVSASTTPADLPPDRALKQIGWETIEPGKGATIGRILLRTKDLRNSGTQTYWEMPANAAGGAAEFATIMENSTTFFPDNVPDNWLTTPMSEVVPMPQVHLAKVAFGRCFVAYDGTIHPSLPGRWGTLERDAEIVPDPQGAKITGLFSTRVGLIATTESSTFLVTPSDDGQNFISQTIHTTAGCVAPSSFAAMANGWVVWLGREGFYAFDGQEVMLVSQDVFRQLRDRNLARQKASCAAYDPKEKTYRCWVPDADSRWPNTCYVWDGEAWRVRNDIAAAAVCTMTNHTRYMVVAGRKGVTNGVWLLDHETAAYPTSNTGSIETTWLAHEDGPTVRSSAKKVYLYLREYDVGSTITVEAMRDWREEVIYTDTRTLRHWPSDVPTSIGTALGTTGARWEVRRPYWTAVPIDLPSCETFKIRISGAGHWEFIGISVEDVNMIHAGARSHQ